jgi:hypothetical protein
LRTARRQFPQLCGQTLKGWFLIGGQGLAKDFAMFSLDRTAMERSAALQSDDQVVLKIPTAGHRTHP